MSTLDDAILVLEAEMAQFKIGTKDSPKIGTPEYFISRAKAVGLSLLRQMRVNGLEPTDKDDNRAEMYYKSVSRNAKIAEISDAS